MSSSHTAKTHTCACKSYDARECIRLRYPQPYSTDDLESEFSGTDRCECCCHDDEEDYDDL